MKLDIKKPLMIAGVASTLTVAGISGAGLASADSSTSTDSDPMSSLVDKIASKFSLNKDEVKAVFDEDRSAHETEMKQKEEERLTQAVTDGKITADQKTQIQAKQTELKTYMDSIKDKTRDEQRSLMDAKRTEVEAWATQNNIPTEYLHFMGGHGGPGGPGGRGQDASNSSDSSSSSQ